jgi:hypothetical protein
MDAIIAAGTRNPAPMPYIPATVFCPKTARLRKPVRMQRHHLHRPADTRH